MEPWSDLEAMASAYLTEVRKVQENGPYYLGGYCLGGSVAFEMTRQLCASGEEVALLALIESSLPAGVLHSPASLAPRVLHMTRRMARAGSGGLVDAFRRQARRLGRQVKRTLHGNTEGWLDEAEDVMDMSAYPEAYRHAAACHFRALRDYKPGPWPGAAWLLRSDDDKLAYLGPSLGWDRFVTGGVRIERVPGDHHGTFRPGSIEIVAEKLCQAMSGAVSQPGGVP
jgi:thioesterase domain-containing protein